jgi:hypothetical protein
MLGCLSADNFSPIQKNLKGTRSLIISVLSAAVHLGPDFSTTNYADFMNDWGESILFFFDLVERELGADAQCGFLFFNPWNPWSIRIMEVVEGASAEFGWVVRPGSGRNFKGGVFSSVGFLTDTSVGSYPGDSRRSCAGWLGLIVIGPAFCGATLRE